MYLMHVFAFTASPFFIAVGVVILVGIARLFLGWAMESS
jgi:hypothetical protein